jgi:hypothetical protein
MATKKAAKATKAKTTTAGKSTAEILTQTNSRVACLSAAKKKAAKKKAANRVVSLLTRAKAALLRLVGR